MKVHVDVTRLATTRRYAGSPGSALTIKLLSYRPDENGNWEAEVQGSRQRVVGWLKRNGYDEGSYTVVED